MGILKKISNLLSPAGGSQRDTYQVVVKCKRCGEIIAAEINLRNDLSVEYENGGNTYFCRKVLMGEGHCFQRVEIELTFDSNRGLLNREITGGEFVD